MTPASVVRLVKRITYKPGWRIWCEQGPWGLLLRIETRAPDPVTGKSVTGMYCMALDPRDVERWDEMECLRTVLVAIEQREKHETREYFRVDGKAPFDPHAPPKR